MKHAIVHVALVVRDYDEAIAFYTERLGFTLVEDTYQPAQDKRWVVVAPSPAGSTGTTLLLARASTPEQARFVGDQAGGRVFLFLATDDFWRDYHRLTAAGVRFVRPPSEAPYGTVAVFEDLYGNRWDLIQYTPPPRPLRAPGISRMGYNPANFAYHIGTDPWVRGYAVSYAITYYDATTGRESPRSRWWGPKTDPKQLYGGFGLIRLPVDPTGQATARRIWRRFEGAPERLIHEIPDNVTTKYQDDVL